jgi:hypothetical protein
MPIHLLQIMFGHMNVKNKAHYLRISDDDIAAEINRIMFPDKNSGTASWMPLDVKAFQCSETEE